MFGFKNAFQGLKFAFISERNFKIQILFFIIVISAGFYFEIQRLEWLAIFSISGFVISLELINSAIEKLCDLYSTEQNPKIKWVKDVSAAAVLVSSLISIGVGLTIFLPKVLNIILS